jgi:hypothetical protein
VPIFMAYFYFYVSKYVTTANSKMIKHSDSAKSSHICHICKHLIKLPYWIKDILYNINEHVFQQIIWLHILLLSAFSDFKHIYICLLLIWYISAVNFHQQLIKRSLLCTTHYNVASKIISVNVANKTVCLKLWLWLLIGYQVLHPVIYITADTRISNLVL